MIAAWRFCVVLVVTVFVLAACGSGAIDRQGTAKRGGDPSAVTRAPSGDESGESQTGQSPRGESGESQTGQSPRGESRQSETGASAGGDHGSSETVAPLPDGSSEKRPQQYSWGLPIGDETVSLNEDVIYRIIQAGDCEGAQEALDDEEMWQGFQSPRAVLLYQAAIYFCGGQTEKARQVFEQAGAVYGWAGVRNTYLDCNIYQAAMSVLNQAPSSGFPCPGGTGPGWPSPYSGLPRDDPRTPQDESHMESTSTSSPSSLTSAPESTTSTARQ